LAGKLPFEFGMITTFEAAPKLHRDLGHATQLHGHTYRVVVAVRSETVGEDGAIIRPKATREAIDRAIGELNHRFLTEVPSLAGVNTTGDELARHLWRQLAGELGASGEVAELAVEAWESPTVYSRSEQAINGEAASR
jgi:6-pyruvoyltetrahydropterin/6-carboxytetrahydropterin synthase